MFQRFRGRGGSAGGGGESPTQLLGALCLIINIDTVTIFIHQTEMSLFVPAILFPEACTQVGMLTVQIARQEIEWFVPAAPPNLLATT